MAQVAVARNAMATRFEVVLHGGSSVSLRAAAEEALDEIERLEADLSLFRPDSAIARVNAQAAAGPVRVPPHVFNLLLHAKQLSTETDGAFDITVAPLMRCWGFRDGAARVPDPALLAEARKCVGMSLVELNANDYTVRFDRPGVTLDLGSIGKGYALDRAVERLKETGVTSALIHGGTSSVCGLGAPPDSDCWKVAVVNPATADQTIQNSSGESSAGVLAVVPLRNESLSVSAVWGRSFEADGKVHGHVMDPRLGTPVQGAVLSAVVLPSATETDALTTALLTLASEGHSSVAQLRTGMKTLLLLRAAEANQFLMELNGIEPISTEIPGVTITRRLEPPALQLRPAPNS